MEKAGENSQYANENEKDKKNNSGNINIDAHIKGNEHKNTLNESSAVITEEIKRLINVNVENTWTQKFIYWRKITKK